MKVTRLLLILLDMFGAPDNYRGSLRRGCVYT